MRSEITNPLKLKDVIFPHPDKTEKGMVKFFPIIFWIFDEDYYYTTINSYHVNLVKNIKWVAWGNDASHWGYGLKAFIKREDIENLITTSDNPGFPVFLLRDYALEVVKVRPKSVLVELVEFMTRFK